MKTQNIKQKVKTFIEGLRGQDEYVDLAKINLLKEKGITPLFDF